MPVADRRRAAKRIALRYGSPRMSLEARAQLLGVPGHKKGAKVAKVKSGVKAKTANRK